MPHLAVLCRAVHTCVISWLSLNAALSKPRFPPGLISRMNPKSMCTMWPWSSNMMLPLCRSFACWQITQCVTQHTVCSTQPGHRLDIGDMANSICSQKHTQDCFKQADRNRVSFVTQRGHCPHPAPMPGGHGPPSAGFGCIYHAGHGLQRTASSNTMLIRSTHSCPITTAPAADLIHSTT